MALFESGGDFEKRIFAIYCTAQITDAGEPPLELTDRLKKEGGPSAKATLTCSLKGDSSLFNEKRERLKSEDRHGSRC